MLRTVNVSVNLISNLGKKLKVRAEKKNESTLRNYLYSTLIKKKKKKE